MNFLSCSEGGAGDIYSNQIQEYMGPWSGKFEMEVNTVMKRVRAFDMARNYSSGRKLKHRKMMSLKGRGE